MDSAEIEKKLEELYTVKKMEVRQYEDDVLEDTEEIKHKRQKAYEKNAATWIDQKRVLLQDAKKRKDYDEIFKINTLFPYPTIRGSQRKLVEDIHRAVNEGKHILTHAPTGLGKTIASIGPVLEYAIRAEKTVLFLTSRQTQHLMAVRTIKDIQDKFDMKINVLDVIGKKDMCLQPGVEGLPSGDFSEYCKKSKKDRTCEFFNNTRKKDGRFKLEAELFIDEQKHKISNTESFVRSCSVPRLCPYEAAIGKGETAQIIICDYSYALNPFIQQIFFRKVGLELQDCILIVDEAHNVPDRVKDSASEILSTKMLQRAMQEADKFDLDEAAHILTHLYQKISAMEVGKTKIENAQLIEKTVINDLVKEKINLEAAFAILEKATETVHEKQRRSYISGINQFLIVWQSPDEGATRIISKDYDSTTIKYACLDPGIITTKIFDTIHNATIMSGTLRPTHMYADLLGLKDPYQKSYTNPFPKENSLELIVPITTTKFDRRNEDEYRAIADQCIHFLNKLNGNTAIFFPSYAIQNSVYKYMYDRTEDIFIREEPRMRKEEKSAIIDKFKQSSLQRKVLLGTSSGSFGEGIDFPGHLLTAVIVIGLPLLKPTLEVQKTIDYYNTKFKKGWDYGYFYPSFNKTFQNAGRCIRTETDRGIIIYLDERFAEQRYIKYFEGRNYIISKNPDIEIEAFQNKGKKE
jgi:DNA excision repair protein ERCC-2